MELIELFTESNADFEFKALNKEDALKKIAALICRNREYLNKEKVFNVLLDREKLGSTGIGNYVAIPHGKMDIEKNLIGAVAISKDGVEFDSIDKKPVKIFFALISSKDATNLHLKILAKISRLLMNKNFSDKLLKIDSFDNFKELLKQF
jgi:PTS system nitrogen regulatory IIA component